MVYSLLIEEIINSMRIVKLVRDVAWIPLHNGNIEKTALSHVSSAFSPPLFLEKPGYGPHFHCYSNINCWLNTYLYVLLFRYATV